MTFSSFVYLNFFYTILPCLLSVSSQPEKPDCEWVRTETPDNVGRMRDISDNRYFYYCIPGLKPLRMMCPQSESYNLFFNPDTMQCAYLKNATERIVENENILTTTTKYKPPTFDEINPKHFECTPDMCGLFPNAHGSCDTYAFCQNGQKIVKKCNGGQRFDINTKECQPAENATCWKARDAGPHIWEKGHECPSHKYKPSQPLQENPDGSVILQNPIVTNWGEWQEWEECPIGMYAIGLYVLRWRLWNDHRGLEDHVGLHTISLKCQTPGGNENVPITAKNPTGTAGNRTFYYMCKGAMVGFQLNSAREGLADEVATDNVKGYCSCSSPIFKPYDDAFYKPFDGHRGEWTETQFCKKYQAICGIQGQMHPYRNDLLGIYDNTGLNNLKMKCCPVENPLNTCEPFEVREKVRDCDNSQYDDILSCNFDSRIGLTLDYSSQQKSINFYSSVGYTFNSMKKDMSKVILPKLIVQMESIEMDYSWDSVDKKVEKEQSIESKTLYVKPLQKVELYQVVANCNYFVIRSNRYVKTVRNINDDVILETLFDI